MCVCKQVYPACLQIDNTSKFDNGEYGVAELVNFTIDILCYKIDCITNCQGGNRIIVLHRTTGEIGKQKQ